MIIKQKDKINYCSHNNRKYNIIATLINNTFRLTMPNYVIEWNINEETPNEISKNILSDSEYNTLKNWIKNAKT